VDEAERLRGEIRAHKAAIRRHREDLGRAKAELSALECASAGIKVVVKGEGEQTHGQADPQHLHARRAS
jgi:hypothetical protein